MEFEERTVKVIIDEKKCEGCQTHACVEACKKFDRSILQLVDGKPGVTHSADELKRLGTECLACEFACWKRGNGAIRIEIPIPGLDEYRKKYGTAY